MKAREQPRVAGRCFGQKLERDGLAELQVGGAIDLAHAAAPEQADDPVAAAEQCAGHETAFVGDGCTVEARDAGRRTGRCAGG